MTIPGMSNTPVSLSSTRTCFPTVSFGGFVVLLYDLWCGLNAVLDSLRRMYASCAATSVSTGERSGGMNYPGCLIGRPNHCLEGDNCPGSHGVSFHSDHPWTKSSFAAWHFSQRRRKHLTLDSAKPLLWLSVPAHCLTSTLLFFNQWRKSCEVSSPSPSEARMAGQELR